MQATVENVTAAPMSAAEFSELAKLEGVVRDWRGQYARVGAALRRIRDLRLYRGQYASWEEYLFRRWDMGLSNAQRLRAASDVAAVCERAGLPVPPNASQAECLAGLEDDQVVAVWTLVQKRLDRGSRPGTELIAACKRSILGAVAGVDAAGNIDAQLAAELASLLPEDAAAVIAAAERRAEQKAAETAADEKVECPWAATLKEIKAGLKRLEHDAERRKQYETILALLQRIVGLLHAA